MSLPTITGQFRLVEAPDLRFTPSGKAVANLRLAASERRKNQAGEWEDGDRVFLGASVWNSDNGQEAEEVAERFDKGERVLVTGALFAREYERQDGTKGQAYELKWATVAAIPGGKPRGSHGGQQGGGGYNTRPARQQQGDPWATPTGGQDPWATPQTEDPPF